jgi:hypothetical protein
VRRLPVLTATAALMVCPAGPAAAQAPDAPPMPPRPMRDTPLAQPPLEAPPATLTDLDAACRHGKRPACEAAGKIRANILSGGALVPAPPPVASGGGGTPPPGDRP